MGGFELNVYKVKIVLAGKINQGGTGCLGRMVKPRKHRFGKKATPERDPVEAAGQALRLPDLERMSQAGRVQIKISRLHFPGNPGALFVAAGRFGTAPDNLGENRIPA